MEPTDTATSAASPALESSQVTSEDIVPSVLSTSPKKSVDALVESRPPGEVRAGGSLPVSPEAKPEIRLPGPSDLQPVHTSPRASQSTLPSSLPHELSQNDSSLPQSRIPSPVPKPEQDVDDDMLGEDAGENPPRSLDINHALVYLDRVKAQFEHKPNTYSRFLDIMKEFKSQKIDTPIVIDRVSELFHGHPHLIEGFNTFLPAGYRIECSTEMGRMGTIKVTTPNGTIMKSTVPSSPRQQDRTEDVDAISPNLTPGGVMGRANPEAMDYVNRIKTRYIDEPEVYRTFLDILQDSQVNGVVVQSNDVYERVTRLFQHSAPDLLDEFKLFLPDRNENGWKVLYAAGGGNEPASDIDKRRKAPAPIVDSHKRKRKAPERDTREHTPVAPSQPKAKRPKTRHPEPTTERQHAHARRPAEENLLFERVKRHVGSREVYDEFLKVVNLFVQELIDSRTLVERVGHFLGDTELMHYFREVIGYDGGKESVAEPSVGSKPLRWDHNLRAEVNMKANISYRRLPMSDTSVVCSGRDELCKSVLNDEYVSHPTWQVGDNGFVAHKKNVYEEALHRSEEERHEYDFHIEAIVRTIALLEPINTKIQQMTTSDERAAFKLKANLGGGFKSVNQRIIKKIYGRDAGQEVINAMQESPANAVPVVLMRLRQKEEEWKRAQREWNKVWREVDKRNYYKSLDHQGITFKANDKKTITSKAFVSQLEAAREEQLSKRASLIDPSFARCRPKYHFEVALTESSVLQDALKLTFSYLDRTQGQLSTADRRRIESFLRAFTPTFFAMDLAQFDSVFAVPDTAESDGMTSEDPASVVDENEEVGSISGRSQRGRRAAANGTNPSGGDLRKKLLKSEQAKSVPRRGREGVGSRHASPAHSIAGPSIRLNGVSNGKSNRKDTLFFANTTFYVLIRLIHLLYLRLKGCKDFTGTAAAQTTTTIAQEAGAGDSILSPAFGDEGNPAAYFYGHLLHCCEKLFDNEIDQTTFEDTLRYMFGTQAYQMYTVDKLIAAIIKQVQCVIAEPKSRDIWALFLQEVEGPTPSSESIQAYRQTVERTLGPEEHSYRVEWDSDRSSITFTLLGKDDRPGEDSEVQIERWRTYLDSYVGAAVTEPWLAKTAPPFLKRTLVKRPASSIVGRSGLEIKVCTQTFRLFYVRGSEEYLYMKSGPSPRRRKALSAAKHRSRTEWLKRFDEGPAGTLPKA
ncbi:hypothetical protein SISSUDRAFT_1042638 [Sistotremastrum suecicum HHB10207 ss-3]|uniref:Histone deacetylase interacting domain-containing protein n=1 Tax=Sistotremastrum suecicum HHB10207 ss-3 TaxID=1314776 RepID=A0A166GDD3_9AGAM|nr:hypothetical protein SISSUDRAFT_1042638 [Sistotremastrum suecicum HHB10207 ss-3]